jgi:hypothetical protein
MLAALQGDRDGAMQPGDRPRVLIVAGLPRGSTPRLLWGAGQDSGRRPGTVSQQAPADRLPCWGRLKSDPPRTQWGLAPEQCARAAQLAS